MTRAAVLSACLLFACGSRESMPAGLASSSASGDTPTGVSAPASASASATATLPAPSKLARKATPSARFQSDEAACQKGDAKACRSVADRFNGYGPMAGCGVDRQRSSPTTKVSAEDSSRDEPRFTGAIRKACQLGDAEACTLARASHTTFEGSTALARGMALRSATEQSGLWLYRSRLSPEWSKVIRERRAECLKPENFCWAPDATLYRREKRAAPDSELSADHERIAIDACASSHDCDEIMMMLDKSGYLPSQLGKVRAAFAATLSAACVAGECTCGSAARYTDDDQLALDLALLACENGEAEGCFALGQRYEEGRGVSKDPARARALYEASCPAHQPVEVRPGPRVGEYSRRACERLADLEGGGKVPPEQRERAMFYAQLACPNSGYEVDHAPCVRLGTYWSQNPKTTGRNGEDARDAAWGPQSDPVLRAECKRPSVKAQCDAFEKTLANVK